MLPTPDLDRKNAHHLYLDVFWYGVLHGSILTYIGVYAARLGATRYLSLLLNVGPAQETPVVQSLKGSNMKISYDREEDILLTELSSSATIDHAEHAGDMILHLDPADRPVFLEIHRASEFLCGLGKASMRPEPVMV